MTAASQGIGKVIAEELAKEGTNIASCTRGRENLEEAAEEIQAHGAKVLTIAADVTNVENVRKVVDETAREFGRLDILVSNAGGIVPGRSVNTSDEEWRYAMDFNLNSAIRFTRAAVPNMRKTGGGAHHQQRFRKRSHHEGRRACHLPGYQGRDARLHEKHGHRPCPR